MTSGKLWGPRSKNRKYRSIKHWNYDQDTSLLQPNARIYFAIFLQISICTLQTVNHVTEGNPQVTPLKKLPIWCEFPTLLIQIKRGVTWLLPWCFLLMLLHITVYYYNTQIKRGVIWVLPGCYLDAQELQEAVVEVLVSKASGKQSKEVTIISQSVVLLKVTPR